jgi:glucose/arabinose dehydrogenase
MCLALIAALRGDVLVRPDGARLVSDATANVIYRVSYAEGR